MPQSPSGQSLLCAYGVVGVVPEPMPSDLERNLAVVVVQINNPGPRITGVLVKELTLLDAEGNATLLRRVQAVEQLSVSERNPSPRAPGSYAYYLNQGGEPFNGALSAGSTRLRIRAALDSAPGNPAHYRLTLGGLAAPLVIEGVVNGAWPT